MTPACGRRPARNPFSTRHTRPGALPYLFPPGDSLSTLLARLEATRGWGQITGPHGTGKSTLLATLLPHQPRPVLLTALHDHQRHLPPADLARLAAAPPGSQVVIDGYEQLGWWSRRRLCSLCRRHGHGLLVTAHAPVGFPHLFTTRVTPATAHAVLAHLLPDADAPLRAADLGVLLTRHRGNLREVLFDLYDVYETRRRGEP